MAVFIKRSQTVVSLSQVDEQQGEPCVAHCIGRPLPAYVFASAPTSEHKYRRLKRNDSLAIVRANDW